MTYSDNDVRVAHFANLCALSSVAGAILYGYEECLEEWAATSKWRVFARRRLLRESTQLHRLYKVVKRYEDEQDKAGR